MSSEVPESLIAQLRRRLKAEHSLVLTLRVNTKASANQISGLLDDGSIKLRITAAPEKGRANAAICDFLADELGVPRRNVRILRGHTSQTKQVEIVA